jgi:ATP synthase protein I
MPDEPDPERLRELAARLERIKEKPALAKANTVKGFSQGEVAWRMVIELVTGMVLGLGIGYGLDAVFDTLPLFLVIFALLGFAAGIRTMLGTARQLATKNDAGTPANDEGN